MTTQLSPQKLIIALQIRAGCYSLKKLAEQVGLAKATIHYHLEYLQAEKLITWQKYTGTIKLTHKGHRALLNYCLLPGGGVGQIRTIEARS